MLLIRTFSPVSDIPYSAFIFVFTRNVVRQQFNIGAFQPATKRRFPSDLHGIILCPDQGIRIPFHTQLQISRAFCSIISFGTPLRICFRVRELYVLQTTSNTVDICAARAVEVAACIERGMYSARGIFEREPDKISLCHRLAA